MTDAAITVFVSYKREDRARVAPLVDCLRSADLPVWWDADIPGGSTWRAEILDHLGRARCVVVVWSHASVSPAGEFVHEEAGQAKQRGVLLPVTIDAVQPPLGFGQVQSLDLTGWIGNPHDVRVKSLIAAVRAKLLGKPAPAPVTSKLRGWGLGAAVALGLSSVGFLANIASLQAVICAVPGVRTACGLAGIGGIPTGAEERAWAARPVGDCQWLKDFVVRHAKGAYGEQAARLLLARRAMSHETWEREELREPIHVSRSLTSFPTLQAARSDAIARAPEAATLACGGFASSAYRLQATRLDDASIHWECLETTAGVRCGCDAQAICVVDAKHSETLEICD